MDHVFNGPMARARYQLLPQYIASSHFAGLGTWRRSPAGDVYAVTAPSADPIEPVLLIVVGRVSSDKVYLGTHGSFNPRFENPNIAVRGAKLQFTLERPIGDPDFTDDFDIAATRLAEVQSQIAKTKSHKHFLEECISGPPRNMRLNFPLWEKMTPGNDTLFNSDFNHNYAVSSLYDDYWKECRKNHQLCAMPVFDVDDTVIATPELFEEKLVGGLVEVTFTLKHYHMSATEKRPEAQDTFAAKIESVSILRAPPTVTRSPYKDMIYTRKPRPMPQTPTRGEHKAAAKAFVPRSPIPPPNFGISSSNTAASSSSSLSTLSASDSSPTSADPVNMVTEAGSSKAGKQAGPAEAVKTRARAREEGTVEDDASRLPATKKTKV